MSRQWRELGLLTNGTEVAGGRGATCCRDGGCEITIFSIRGDDRHDGDGGDGCNGGDGGGVGYDGWDQSCVRRCRP